MNAKEIAEKIWEDANTIQKIECVPMIAAALERYRDEGITEDRKLWDAEHALDLKLQRREARAKALEEAARKSEAHRCKLKHLPRNCVCENQIGDDIRSLQSKGK